MINGAITLVSFPTLNLGFETCLHDKMTTLEKVWWQLSFPLYLFILMGVTTCLARTKCLKFNRSAGFSIIQAFATLLILCYISVLEVCIELIGFKRISTIEGRQLLQWVSDPTVPYFGKGHRFLGIVALLLLVTYIFPLPLFLLFPSALYKNKFLSKFKPIYDAFWNPFKPKYRFFLGFRLLFRWLPFVLVFLVRAPINLFITNFFLILLLALQIALQPFREKWQNNVDIAFLLNLILLFSGSVFFWSEYSFADQNKRSSISLYGLSYASALIAIGFVFMFTIILHSAIMRYVALRKLVGRCLCKTPLGKFYQVHDHVSETTHARLSVISADESSNNQNSSDTSSNALVHTKFQRPIYGASELREPLIESGTIDIVDLDPSSVPPRIQTTYNVQN